MTNQLQPANSTGRDEVRKPTKFIVASVLIFIASVSVTVYFCSSMCCDMEMPGGWTMSMMWMRMPGQTWLESGLTFLLMWLTMMIAMMMPSALSMFLKTKRQWTSLCYMASGYFVIWLVAGLGIYIAEAVFAMIAMRSELYSRTVPLILSASLITAGVIQFTRWKKTNLLRCRSAFGCGVSCTQQETSFRLGCKQGAACCICCAAPMTIQLALGIMNPFVMIAVAIIITAEKLLPHPEVTARLIGIAAIFAGIAMI